MSAISLGIVCPMANEEDTAARFIDCVLDRCRSFHFKSTAFFVVLDRASSNQTRDIVQSKSLRTPELRYIYSPENKSVVDAYLRGYREALGAGCDWILEIDAGFSHEPDEIPHFFRTMRLGYDCVFGSRFCPGGSFRQAPLGRYLVSWGGTILANLFLGTKLHDMTSGFELFTSSALREILDNGILSRGPFFQTEIRAYAHRFRIAEVPIHYTAPSPRLRPSFLLDAFFNLFSLVAKRLSLMRRTR